MSEIPDTTPASPGRAAYEAFSAAVLTPEALARDVPFAGLGDEHRAAWEAAADAGTAAHSLSGTGALMGDIIALRARLDGVLADRNDLAHLNTSQASRIRELGASLSSLTDRAEAGKVITGDEADEYRSLIAAPVPVPDGEEDDSPGYWQVRAALRSALNALQLVALSQRRQQGAGEPEQDARAEAKLAEVRSVLLEGGQDAPTARRRALAIISTGETPGTASEEEN